MKRIRRSDREISFQEVRKILDNAEYGVLSTVGKDGQPYGVPLSYVYKNDSIYFHCALSGHKLDNIGHNAKVSFCVVGNTKVLPDKFATEYESTVIFGVVSEVKETERHNVLLEEKKEKRKGSTLDTRHLSSILSENPIGGRGWRDR